MVDVGARFADRYVARRLVGTGGLGDVWQAHDERLDRPVAVKLLRGGNPDLRRFEAEVRAQAALAHPAIVRLFDTGTHEGSPYLVMAYVDGRPLSEFLTAGPMAPDALALVGRQVAEALAHAHGRGVVHRDVKPGNILIDQDGAAHLSDFGIARLEDAATLTRTGTVVGTAAYIAPEQLSGEPARPAADIYALGLVLLEALTGRREYGGTPIEAAMARLQRPPRIPDDLPDTWRTLLTAMVHDDPAQRVDAVEVAARLSVGTRVGDDAQTAVLPPEGTPTAPLGAAREDDGRPIPGDAEAPRRSRRPVLALGVAAAVAIALALGGAALSGPGAEPVEPGDPSSLSEALDELDRAVAP